MKYLDKNHRQLSLGDCLLFDNGYTYELFCDDDGDEMILQNMNKIMPRLYAKKVASNGIFTNAIWIGNILKTDK